MNKYDPKQLQKSQTKRKV